MIFILVLISILILSLILIFASFLIFLGHALKHWAVLRLTRTAFGLSVGILVGPGLGLGSHLDGFGPHFERLGGSWPVLGPHLGSFGAHFGGLVGPRRAKWTVSGSKMEPRIHKTA